MDVTNKNFRELLPELEELIERANFFVIDSEFTGLADNNVLAFDTPEEVYIKANESTNGYILIQLGLTVFYVDETDTDSDKKLKYKSFNFYAYPRSRKHIFKCQGESLAFLASNNFDFNKLFSDGITFCDVLEADRLKQSMECKQLQRQELKMQTPQAYVAVPITEQVLITKTGYDIEEFIKSESENELVIENMSPLQRKLIHNLVEAKYSDSVRVTSKNIDKNFKGMVVTRKLSAEEEILHEQELAKKKVDELKNIVGLSVVLQMISHSSKLIVGHNMLLDIIYIVRQFFGPLPDKYSEFKKYVHFIFPNILDTKHMCSMDKFKGLIPSNTLPQLMRSVTREPFTFPDIAAGSSEYAYNLKEPKEHEAGFDSYQTGLCFLALMTFLNKKSELVTAKNKIIKKLLNKIHLMRVQDVPYIDLTHDEPIPNRDHVFHITFPEAWRQSNIVNAFKNFGYVHIVWIDSTSAFVALERKNMADKVISKITGPSVAVQTFKAFKNPISEELMKKEKHKSESISNHCDGQTKKAKVEGVKKQGIVETFEVSNNWS